MHCKHLVALTATLVSTSLAAQTAGTYVTFGGGCGKTGASCFSQNPAGGTNAVQSLTNEYAYPIVATTALNVTGFRIFTSSISGVRTVAVKLYGSTGGIPDANPLASTLITVGPTQAFYRASFDKPYPMAAGTFFISADNYEPTANTTAAVYASNLSAGNTVTGIYWRRIPTNTTTWAVTGIIQRPSYHVECDGGPVAVLSNTGLPEINKSFSVDLLAAPAKPAINFLGASKTSHGPIPLPFHLAILGGAGCWVFSSLDISFATATDASGKASVSIGVPNDRGLIGVEFHNQYLVIDATALPLRILFSNGGTGKVGG